MYSPKLAEGEGKVKKKPKNNEAPRVPRSKKPQTKVVLPATLSHRELSSNTSDQGATTVVGVKRRIRKRPEGIKLAHSELPSGVRRNLADYKGISEPFRAQTSLAQDPRRIRSKSDQESLAWIAAAKNGQPDTNTPPVGMKEHTCGKKVYKNSFLASDLVDWLMRNGQAKNRKQAEAAGRVAERMGALEVVGGACFPAFRDKPNLVVQWKDKKNRRFGRNHRTKSARRNRLPIRKKSVETEMIIQLSGKEADHGIVKAVKNEEPMLVIDLGMPPQSTSNGTNKLNPRKKSPKPPAPEEVDIGEWIIDTPEKDKANETQDKPPEAKRAEQEAKKQEEREEPTEQEKTSESSKEPEEEENQPKNISDAKSDQKSPKESTRNTPKPMKTEPSTTDNSELSDSDLSEATIEPSSVSDTQSSSESSAESEASESNEREEGSESSVDSFFAPSSEGES